jgi:DNA-binding IclR family transcriptional regulator
MNDDPLLIYKVEELSKQVKTLRAEIEMLRAERAAEQRKRLQWGVSALGAAVIALAGTIWAMLPHSAQEAWNVLRGGSVR